MNTTTTLCRCCNEPMDSFDQETPNGKPRLTCATCVNDDCAMNGFTFSLNGYPEIDLAKYHATEYEAADDVEICDNCNRPIYTEELHWRRVDVDHYVCKIEPDYYHD